MPGQALYCRGRGRGRRRWVRFRSCCTDVVAAAEAVAVADAAADAAGSVFAVAGVAVEEVAVAVAVAVDVGSELVELPSGPFEKRSWPASRADSPMSFSRARVVKHVYKSKEEDSASKLWSRL